MPSLRSTPCKSKIDDERWKAFDAFRSQASQSQSHSPQSSSSRKVPRRMAERKPIVKDEPQAEAKVAVRKEESAAGATEGDVEIGEESDELSEPAEEDEDPEEEEDAADEEDDEERNESDGEQEETGEDGDRSEHNDSARNTPPRGTPPPDRKPDIKPLLPHHEPTTFLSLADDILLEITHHLIAAEAYASAVALLGTSQRMKTVLRPLIRRTKRRIVLDLDDLRWVDRKTWKDVRIITCTDVSALPFPLPSDSTEDEMKDHRKEVRRDLADLQPWALVYYGEPGEIAITLQERFFPSVRVIRIHTDLGVHEMAYLHPDTLTDKVNSSAGNLDEALNALRKNSAANPRQPQLRIRSHHRYRTDIERDRPGQMYVKWSVSHYGPAMMVERESCGEVDLGHLEYMEDDFKYWLRDNLEHPLTFVEDIGFDTIALDFYYQPHPTAKGLFYSADDEFPAAYDILSEYADEVAEKWLESTTLKPLAELKIRFFVVHGAFQTRDEMKPVFKTFKAKKYDGSVKTRELFIDDADFARCVKNGGCTRCRGTAV